MTGPKIKPPTALSRKDVVTLPDVELLDLYASLSNERVTPSRYGPVASTEWEKLRAEILRRMGQDWRSRQRSEAGRMGGSATAARKGL